MEKEPATNVVKKHLLIVDDNEELALTYKQLFEDVGFRVDTAFNGVSALKFIMNRDVDAVLCDLAMPQLEGDMFYVSVQRAKPHLCERFIFITGVPDNPKFQPFIAEMGPRVLFKPVPFDELLAALKAVCKISQPSAT